MPLNRIYVRGDVVGSLRVVRRGSRVYVQDSDFYLADQIAELRKEVMRLRRLLEKIAASQRRVGA